MINFLLYASATLIWGSTWLGIKFQLGQVDPLVSVVYRFCLAAGLLFVWCGLRGLSMRFAVRDHLFIALQGACLFAVNYWLFYLAEVYLTSGIVAVMFSTIVFWNILNGRIFLKTPIRPQVIMGTGLGIVGIGLVFWPEITVQVFAVLVGIDTETQTRVMFSVGGFQCKTGGRDAAYAAPVGVDHVHDPVQGALPFLLREINVPVYGTAFTLELVRHKLEEHGLIDSATLHVISPRDRLRIGPFEIICLQSPLYPPVNIDPLAAVQPVA